jgi:hypothetical protein
VTVKAFVSANGDVGKQSQQRPQTTQLVPILSRRGERMA